MPVKKTPIRKISAIRKVSPKINPAEKVLEHVARTFRNSGDDYALETLTESMKLLGFSLGDPEQNLKKKNKKNSFIVPENTDGAITNAYGGAYGSYLDIEGISRTELELITRYREMSKQPEPDYAIQDIVNEAIVNEDNNKPPITIEIEDIPNQSIGFKKVLSQEFQNILQLLDFKQRGQEIFKRWYVDGRLYYNIMVDETDTSKGITELRYIDPRRIKKVREYKTRRVPSGAEVSDVTAEYYIYNPKGIGYGAASGAGSQQAYKISPDSIVYCNSGLVDANNNTVLSYLHPCIKPLNQLRFMEDAVVIYRISRAAERRIFYVDVGNMPGVKAQQYLNDLMTRHRNKLVYDSNTGETRDDKKFLSMMEDFWIPRREGQKSTEIDTLPGGENLGKIEDIEYFEKKLYQALRVPISRMQSDGGFNMGRSSEISRDEEKFNKFITLLRKQFSDLFYSLLRSQLLIKGLCTEADWVIYQPLIYINFAKNSIYVESAQAEVLQARLGMLEQIAPFIGSYFSPQYVYREILKLSADEIEKMQAEIDSSKPRMSFTEQIQMQMQQQQLESQAEVQMEAQEAEQAHELNVIKQTPKPAAKKS